MLSLVMAVIAAQAAPQEAPQAAPQVTRPAGPAEESIGSGYLLAPPSAPGRVDFLVAGGGAYQFRTDLDDGGSVATTRIPAGMQFRLGFTEQLSLGLNLGYRFDRYEFRGDVFPGLGSGVDPWRDIHAVGIGAILNWAIDERWSVSGGPLFQFAGEESADVDQAFSGGGLIAAACRVSDDLLVGGGVGVVSRIDDDPLVFPQILLDWRINDELRLTTRGGPTAVIQQPLELVWSPAPPLELAIGARYEYLRFRLSEGNSYSEGIGQEKSLPVWLRVSWLPAHNVRFDFFGGVAAYYELQLSDSSGSVLAEDKVDPAPFVAGYVSVRF